MENTTKVHSEQCFIYLIKIKYFGRLDLTMKTIILNIVLLCKKYYIKDVKK